MSRSLYVYVVSDDVGRFPLATFTVKRELVNYLKKLGRSDVFVCRMPDGDPSYGRVPSCRGAAGQDMMERMGDALGHPAHEKAPMTPRRQTPP